MSEGLRDRTRRAVRAELSVAAQDLFLVHGFDATTVDQIAAAAGISKRSFFRYFGSKEDVVLDKYALLGEQLLDAVAVRPVDEPAWDSLRRAFDVVVDYYSDEHRRDRAAMMEGLVAGSPLLQAGYLRTWDDVKVRLAALLEERSRQTRRPMSGLLARVTVDAAIGCLSGAVRDALANDAIDTLPGTLDDVMTTLRPHSA